MNTHSNRKLQTRMSWLKDALSAIVGIHTRTPEWDVLAKALESGNTAVSAIGLEVLASHFRDKLTATDRLVLHVVATALRMGDWEVIDNIVEPLPVSGGLLNVAA